MEPLQEAIEKARKQREGEIGQTAVPGETAPGTNDTAHEGPYTQATPRGGVARESAREAGAKSLPLPADVRYVSTRTIEPEADGLEHNRVIAGQLHDPRVGAYRQLRSQLLDSMQRNNWHSLAITSAHEGAGKTLTAINLAISISQEVNQTVMLVDLDLSKPNVHTTLDIQIDKGIVDHLQHGEPLENILLNPGYPRLVVLPGLPQGHSSSEMLSSPEMKRLVLDITNRYPDRIIIFDLPPLLRDDDALVFVPNADACLLVVEDGVSTPDDIDRSLQLLKHTQLIGTILNKAR